MPYKLVWKMRQGDWLRHTFTLKEKANPTAVAVPIDLTGAAILIQIRPTVADDGGSTILTLSTTNGRILTPGSDGKVNVSFDDGSVSTGTGNPALDQALFDIQVTFPSGQPRTFPAESNGLIQLIREVTR